MPIPSATKEYNNATKIKASEREFMCAWISAHAIAHMLTCLVIIWCMGASYRHGVERTYTNA